MIKWSNTTDGFHQLLLSERVPWFLCCYLLLKQSFMYWDDLIMYHIHLWCFHSWLFFTLPCLLALNWCWLIIHGSMNVHNTFYYFTVFEIYYSLLFIHHVCENAHHCLLCNKNGNFCTMNIILYTMIICYFNVFASSFVFSIYSYTLDVSSCCRTFWVCIVVKCSDSCGGCSCTTDVWACATVSTFATLPSTSGPKPFVPVLCVFNLVPRSSEEAWRHQCICKVLTLKLECLYLIPLCHLSLMSLSKSFHPFVSVSVFSTAK